MEKTKVKDWRKLREFVHNYTHNSRAMVGLCMLVFILMVALLADVIAPFRPQNSLTWHSCRPAGTIGWEPITWGGTCFQELCTEPGFH